MATTTTREPDTGAGGPALGLAEQFRPILLRLDLLVRRQATQYALSRAQTSILHTLACHGRLRMTDLARLENVRVPTTSNSVSVIEAMGYVEREPDESDRRGVCVRLTDLGRARIEQVLADRDRDFARHLDRLSSEQRHLLTAAVPAFTALLDSFDTDPE
ncbi:MarR family transcriptional regulator [Dietzia sp. CH92]|uniref:MarR family winged helix-turn-helix transcriptional regulator n=1 Tax=Dietzia sp. CH92 TaxID=3051823 RepID=UPI0028D0AD3F|nr:MarR family transcriptional regulator [Dietzia sp. CH92]